MVAIEVLANKFGLMVAGSGDWGVARNQECQSQPYSFFVTHNKNRCLLS